MMDDMRHAFDEHNIEKIHAASRRNDAVDILSVEVIKYLGRVRQSILTEDESATQEQLAIAMTNLASLADVMASEIGTVAKTYLEGEYEATSDETREMVEGLWDSVKKALDLAVRAVGEGDQHPAQDVLLLRDNVAELADALFKRHAQRLRADDPKYLERVRLLMTFIEQLRHVYTLTKRIARTQLPVEIAREAA
jgi:phosphate:Na+ symporter